MMQLLVGLTVIFVVFVIYEVFKTVSRSESAPSPEAAPEPKAVEAAGKPAVAEAAEPVAVEAAHAERGAQLRNPATGEVSPAPTNYRFAKKWVKEALVAEGLLDRVYKPTELNDAVAAKTKDALDKLKTLDKYRA
jgi:zona occludens toxin (predicted ATPase)